GLVNWEDLSVENVNQVEVLKGAASALYGSSAMNGIINLRTGYAKSTPETEAAIFTTVWGTPQNEVMQWWGRDTSEIQQPLQSGFSFVHRRKEKKLDVVLSAYALYRDSYNRNSFSRYGRISPNLRYRIHDRLTVGLNTNFNFGRSGSFFLWGNDTNLAMQPGMNSATQSKGRLRFTVDPTINYFDKNGNQHKFLSRVYYIQNNNDNNQSNQSQNYYGEYQFQRKFQKSNIVITAGMVGVYNHTKAKLYSDGAFSLTNYATYLQLDKKFFERLNVSAGLRYEGYLLKSPTYVDGDTIPNGTTKEGKPVMRIGANYQLSQATYLRASWGQGYRFPTIAEKFITTNFGVASVVPNAKLFSETGWSAEFGVKQGFKIREWQGFADAAFFWSEYNNMMEFNFLLLPPPRLVGFQSQNIGNTKITGVEFSIVGQGSVFNIPLSLMTGYTKIDPTFRSFTAVEDSLSSASYNVLKYRFRHSFKFDAEAKFVNEKLSVGTNIVYNSFMEAIDAVFGVFITGLQDWRTRNNHGVTIVDVRAGYQFTPRWKASFICSNLTNKEYSVRPALLEAPRGYTLRLDYSLK
ncbi:MAG: TonB-dependent receptor, partial [Saprospiraceae bacterium]